MGGVKVTMGASVRAGDQQLDRMIPLTTGGGRVPPRPPSETRATRACRVTPPQGRFHLFGTAPGNTDVSAGVVKILTLTPGPEIGAVLVPAPASDVCMITTSSAPASPTTASNSKNSTPKGLSKTGRHPAALHSAHPCGRCKKPLGGGHHPQGHISNCPNWNSRRGPSRTRC